MLSSVGYLFYPRYVVFTMAMTNAVESLYKAYSAKLKTKAQEIPKIMRCIDKVPFIYIMFVIGGALNLQLSFFYPSLVNKFVFKILSLATNGKGDRVVRRVVDALMGFS